MKQVAAVYADGGVVDVNPSPVGGTWAFVFVDAEGRRIAEQSGVILPGVLGLKSVSNNVAEFFALIAALDVVPHGWAGTVYSDSQVTLGRLFRGWKLTGLPPFLVTYGARVRQRLDLPNIKHVLLSGHPTQADLLAGVSKKRGLPVSEHNVRCDELCRFRAAELRQALSWACPCLRR